MFSLEVEEFQISDIEKQLGRLESQAKSVLSKAINRTASTVKQKLVSKVQQEFTYKDNLKDKVKYTTATKSKLRADFVLSGKRLSLHKFDFLPGSVDYKSPPSHYTYRIRKDGADQSFNGIFLQKIRYNHLCGEAIANATEPMLWKRANKEKYSIRLLHGPSVPEMFAELPIVNSVLEEARVLLQTRIDQEIEKCLAKG